MWNGAEAKRAGVATKSETKGFVPRREPRFTVPAFSVQIAVVLTCEGKKYKARLWDVSQSGCCIAIPEKEGCPDPGDLGKLVIRDPNGISNLEPEATVQWVDHVGSAYFVGFKYFKRMELEGTYLGAYAQKG
ncbi:MAG: PilZ domain-containing protein [Synechococcus sp.]